jgi:hypothetical protein
MPLSRRNAAGAGINSTDIGEFDISATADPHRTGLPFAVFDHPMWSACP